MILARKQGLGTLHALIAIVSVPVFFLVFLALSVEVFGIVGYWQVELRLYVAAIVIAMLLRFHARREATASGRKRFVWVHAVRETNHDVLLLALLLFGVVFATKDQAISRLFIGSFLVSAWMFLFGINRFAPEWLARLFFRGDNSCRTLLIGHNSATAKIREWANEGVNLGVRLVGLVKEAADSQTMDLGVPILGHVDELPEILVRDQVDQVILLDTHSTRQNAESIYETCRRAGVRVLMFNHWEEHFAHPISAINEGSLTFFAPGREPLQNPLNRVLKRLLDIGIALPVVILLLPPLTLIVWFMQRRQAPGPLLFRQVRNGKSMRPFPILKFRTMYYCESASAQESLQAMQSDPRVFPFGRLLRRTSLDEFPQFVNVLLGSMSVVGPRPHLIAHDVDFSRQVEYYRNRHFAKPGITGMAQHRGFRGEIKNSVEIRERVRLDLEYIQNWSFWLDVGIIVKTAWHVLFPTEKAY